MQSVAMSVRCVLWSLACVDMGMSKSYNKLVITQATLKPLH